MIPFYFFWNIFPLSAFKAGISSSKLVFKALFILSLFFLFSFSQAAELPKTDWYLLGGGGRSYPGWGNTQVEVRTRDVALRLEHLLYKEKGTALLRHEHRFTLEMTAHFLQNLNQPPMFGVNFFACWVFTYFPRISPYFFAGGGPVFTKAEIPGTSSVLRGAYSFGSGFRWDLSVFQILFETRYHHLSNGGIEKPNNPLNSFKILFGLKMNFFWLPRKKKRIDYSQSSLQPHQR